MIRFALTILLALSAPGQGDRHTSRPEAGTAIAVGVSQRIDEHDDVSPEGDTIFAMGLCRPLGLLLALCPSPYGPGNGCVGLRPKTGNFITLAQEEDLRELSGMTQQDLDATKDLQSFNPSNTQFKKLLYRTGTVDPVILRQWAVRTKETSLAKTALEKVALAPQQHRFHPFSLEASALSVQRYDFSDDDARDFLSGFFIALCEAKDGTKFTLLSRSSISTWPKNEKLPTPQPIQFDGFFLGNLSLGSVLKNKDDENVQPVFVARRFAWHPQQADESLGVDDAKVALANGGVDIALLDVVKARKGKSIGTREATCFWQMMAACKKTKPIELPNRIDFETMLREPLKSVGKAASIQGRVRQCVPVKVTSSKAIELLGTDTWYQLTVFPDLDGRPIQVATRDGDPEVYRNAFPVTVCVLDLPDGYNGSSITGNTFQFDGFFYRIWAYPSERTEKSGLDGQPSPLIMASSIRIVESTSGQLRTLLTAVLMSIAIAIAVIGWFVFRTRKSAARTELPEKIQTW